MAGQRARKVTQMYKLDSKPYADKVKKASEAADRALRRYGEPRMSLAELRAALDKELSSSLTELVLKERDARW
jgi:hypothetical protein